MSNKMNLGYPVVPFREPSPYPNQVGQRERLIAYSYSTRCVAEFINRMLKAKS